jgi:hypothetical protein
MGAAIRCGFAVLACVLLGASSAYAEKVKGAGEFPGANGVPFEALELQQFFLEHSLVVLRDPASAPDAECPPGFALRALDPLTCERVDGEVRMQVLK